MHCATDSAAGVAHVAACFRFRSPAIANVDNNYRQ